MRRQLACVDDRVDTATDTWGRWQDDLQTALAAGVANVFIGDACVAVVSSTCAAQLPLECSTSWTEALGATT